MFARTGLSRGQLLILLILAALLVVMAFLQSQPDESFPYDPADSQSAGLRALTLWLEELEYPVTVGVPRAGIPPGPGLLLIHPTYSGDLNFYSAADAAATYEWVRKGGTLVLVGPLNEYAPLAEQFGVVQVNSFTGFVADVRQVQPLLPDVPVDWEAFATALSLSYVEEYPNLYQANAIVPVLTLTSGEPVVAIQAIGNGTVWHLTEDFAFTNLNLRDDRIAALLPAILRTVPAGAPAIISTHHLRRYQPNAGGVGAATLQDWLYTHPFGQATLLILVAIMAFLLLQGRRLGPPLPGPSASRPREAAEYVAAMAGLQRRMRRPQTVAEHHRQRLKQGVGRLAQLPADRPDDEWLAQLQRAALLTPAQREEVRNLLSGYAALVRAKSSAETDLIQLVQATDALLAALPRATQLVR